MYDAIVIGARCAGSPTAMLLARKGYRVLVVDRATFPSDTLSTHYMWPMGCTYLARWGLLDTLLSRTPSWDSFSGTIEGITLTGTPPEDATRRRLRDLHGDDTGYVNKYMCPRRQVLDAVLREAAEAAGAEVRESFSVEELVEEGGRVAGIVGRTRGGERVTERARVVIGADGRHSFLARTLKVPVVRERSTCTFAYWTYFSGLSIAGIPGPVHQRGRLRIAFGATNDGLHMLLSFGPSEWFADFRKDIEGNHLKSFDLVCPELGARLREGARREERMYGTAEQANEYRYPVGPGWALVGDSAYMKDQCTALGMTHAFRGVELLVSRLDEGLSGRRPIDEALADYARRQNALADGYLDFVAAQAAMTISPREELQLLLAMRGNQQHIDRFIGVFGDVIPAGEFMAPANLSAITTSAKESPDGYPIFQEYRASAAEYARSPFAT